MTPGDANLSSPPAHRARRDHLSDARRRQVMSRIRRRDTLPELKLRSALWRAGIRGWRNDYADAPGRPDLAFTKARVAVFVDGGLWHGHPTKYPARLSGEWLVKIGRNLERDAGVNAKLVEAGWRVIRLWDVDINRDTGACVQVIIEELRRSGSA